MKTEKGLICAALLALCLVGFSPSLSAQETGSGSVTRQFRQGLIEFSKELSTIIKDVKSVADAEKAEPRIVKAMDRLTSIVIGFVNNFGNMTREQGLELANLGSLMQDPEVRNWIDKIEVSTTALEKEHPEAAAKLEEIGNTHGARFLKAMEEIRTRIQQHMEKYPSGGSNE